MREAAEELPNGPVTHITGQQSLWHSASSEVSDSPQQNSYVMSMT